MANWSVIYDNEELRLTGRGPFDHVSVQGIGVPPVRRLTERSPFQDGDTDVGFRLDPRTINIVLISTAASLAQADAQRDTLFNYFKPLANQLALRCVRDDGTLRQIDCALLGMLDAPVSDQERIGGYQRYAVQLRAAEPIWYDPQIHYWAALGGSSTGLKGFSVPVAVPWIQSTLTVIDTNIAFAYAGSWSSYPIIKLFGPANGVKIENLTTQDVLNFPALTLTAGHWIEVDLRYGHKSVVDDLGANRIGELSSDSDLATWHLAPFPDAPGGENVIHFKVNASATDATGVQIAYYDRFVAN
jgi:hypothetical protein